MDQLRFRYEQRISRHEPDADGRAANNDATQAAERRHELISVERRRLADLRRRGEISAETQRRIEHELDLDESRLVQ